MNKINKKAGTGVQYLLENAFRIGFLMIALVIFFLLINFYVSTKIDIKQLQAETISARILYSEAITYQDPNTYRTYPGIIDASKFNSERLDEFIPYTFSKYIAVKLTLFHKDGATLINEAHLNKQQYETWKVLIDSNIQGKGSVTYFQKLLPVTYKEKDGSFPYATLMLEILVPNS